MAGEPAIVIESPEEAEGPPINLDEAAPVEQQPPQREQAAKAAPSEVPAKPSIEEELQQLKRDLISKDQARQQAEQQRQVAQRETVEARTQAADGQYHMLRNAVDARQAAITGMTQNLQRAWETGDFAAAAAEQAKISDMAAEKKQFEMHLYQMEEQRKAQPQPQTKQQEPGDPVERYLSTIQDPRARDWLRSHPDCLPNGQLHNQAMAAHFDAMANGMAQGSDAYWQHIETSTGYREAPQKVTQQAPPTKRQASHAAPPSRSTPGLNGQQRQTGPRVLTSREADIAKELGMTNEEYWTQKQGAIADGNYHKPHNFSE